MLKKFLPYQTAPIGKIRRFVFFHTRILSHCFRLLKINRATKQASSLAYYTIFSVIPIVIVMLLLFQLSPQYRETGEKLKDYIYNEIQLSNIKYELYDEYGLQSIQVTLFIDNIITNFFESLNQGKGSITAISVIFIIWAALAMLLTVENAFNSIWCVSKKRNLIIRIIYYWSILTLGPLLIAAGFYIITQYSALAILRETIVSHLSTQLISYAVAVIILFLLYFLIPNTKVLARAALWGALIAALVWTIVKWGFGLYVTEFIPYNQVYGVLGLIPLSALWIYISWLIVLFGLELAFSSQNFEVLEAARFAAENRKGEVLFVNDKGAVNIMREIAAAFEGNSAPVSIEVLSTRFDMPPDFANRMLNHFISRGLLVKTSEPRAGYVPAKDPEHISLLEIAEAVAAAGYAQYSDIASENFTTINKAQQEILKQYNLKQVLDSGSKA